MWLDWLLIALATWRLSFMVAHESGPWRVFERLRTRYPLGGLTNCMRCLSVWIAAFLFVTYDVLQPAVIILAISGAALMLHSYTGAGHE